MVVTSRKKWRAGTAGAGQRFIFYHIVPWYAIAERANREANPLGEFAVFGWQGGSVLGAQPTSGKVSDETHGDNGGAED